MKKLLLFIALTIFGLGLNAQNVGDVTSIRYGYYSLEFTVTSVEPAECELSSYSGAPIDVTIPATVEIEGNDFSVTSIGNYTFEDCENLTSIELPNSVTSIGKGAFYYCESLTSIELPNSVTSIGDYAFSDCENLTSIELPNSVSSIGEGVFAECYSLTSIELPNSVTSIGDYAFCYCESLTSIEIPNSVTSIGDYAFTDCYSLTSIEIPSSVTSIGDYAFSYCSSLTSIEIPNSVTSIGEGAFSGLESLTRIAVAEGNVVYDSRDNCNAIIETATNTLISGCQSTIIPNSVTSIGESAFYECSGLTSIEIPNSVTSIGNSAFSVCLSLASIEIPNSVTSIGNRAFYWCSSLASIEIPNSVTSIGNRAFYWCSSLASIEIPNSVTSIGEYAFSDCSSLTSIEIPNSITSIGEWAFYGCESLRVVKCYVENVPETGYGIFVNCPSDMIILVPANSVDDYKAIYPWNEYNLIAMPEDGEPYVGDHVMIDYEGYSLIYIITDVENTECKVECAKKPTTPASVTISSSVEISGKEYSVTSIGESAFSECKNLTNIEIPNSVTSIGERAFSDCLSLTNIKIPNSVISMGEYAFYECSGLIVIKCYAENIPETDYSAFISCPSNMMILVPENSVEEYKAASPWNDYNIIALPENGEPYVGDFAVIDYEGYSLIYIITDVENTECKVACAKKPTTPASVTIPSSVEISGKEYSVTSVGEKAFYGCSSLTSIEIPNSVISIGNNAFSECESLTSIEIPNSVTSIGSEAFRGCSSLTSIEIPNSVTSIGESAFYECSGLTSIEIPNSVISIGKYAFYGCSGLTSIEIPNSITSIEGWAFEHCSSLTSIEIPNSVTSIGIGAFSGCSSLTSIVVEYRNTVYDSRNNCNAIIETATNTLIAGCQNTIIPKYVTSIGNHAFSRCSSLTSIEIPNSVTSIENYAFYFCSSLTNIEIPNTVTSIGSSAFGYCSSLTSITFGDNPQLTSIGEDAFYESGLTSIKIPNSMTSIGDYTFYQCRSLTSIEIPNSVTSIGEDAFYFCSLRVVKCYAENVPEADYSAFNSCPSNMKIYVPEISWGDYKTANPWNEFTLLSLNDYENLIPAALDTLYAEAINDAVVVLSWDKVEDATSYNVYSGYTLIEKVTNTALVVTDLVAETTYTFDVTVVNEFGESERKSVTVTTLKANDDGNDDGNDDENENPTDTIVPTPEVLAIPENLIANVLSTSSIILTWDNVENALSYNVYRDDEMIINVTNTNYTDNNLEYNTEYCYTVTAVRNETESDKSEEVCAKTLGESINELSSSINIYPNPVENELFIATEMNVKEVAIYDVYGRLCCRDASNASTSNSMDTFNVSVQDLEAGIYFVNVKTENGNIVKRFVKK